MCHALFMPMGGCSFLNADGRGMNGKAGRWELEWGMGVEEGGKIVK